MNCWKACAPASSVTQLFGNKGREVPDGGQVLFTSCLVTAVGGEKIVSALLP